MPMDETPVTQKLNNMKHPQYQWIVDYDLPSVPSTARVKLWRAIVKRNPSYKKSSESVIFTSDKAFAKFVYAMAARVGATRVSLYRAELIKSRRRGKEPKLLSPPCMWEREILGED